MVWGWGWLLLFWTKNSRTPRLDISVRKGAGQGYFSEDEKLRQNLFSFFKSEVKDFLVLEKGRGWGCSGKDFFCLLKGGV